MLTVRYNEMVICQLHSDAVQCGDIMPDHLRRLLGSAGANEHSSPRHQHEAGLRQRLRRWTVLMQSCARCDV